MVGEANNVSRYLICSVEPILLFQNYKEMQDKVKSIFEAIKDPELQGTYYPLDGMSKDTQQQLIDDHFLFKEGDRSVILNKIVLNRQNKVL